MADENFAYILTREHNQYDQYGEYFVAWFPTLPDADELAKLLNLNENGKDLVAHILKGGGRLEWEDKWFFLRRVASNTLMKDDHE